MDWGSDHCVPLALHWIARVCGGADLGSVDTEAVTKVLDDAKEYVDGIWNLVGKDKDAPLEKKKAAYVP